MNALIPVRANLGFIHLAQFRQRWKSFDYLKGPELSHNQMCIIKEKKPMKEPLQSAGTKLLKIVSEIEV